MVGAVGLRSAAPSFDWLDTVVGLEAPTFVTIKSFFFGKTVSHFSNAQTSAALGLYHKAFYGRNCFCKIINYSICHFVHFRPSQMFSGKSRSLPLKRSLVRGALLVNIRLGW